MVVDPRRPLGTTNDSWRPVFSTKAFVPDITRFVKGDVVGRDRSQFFWSECMKRWRQKSKVLAGQFCLAGGEFFVDIAACVADTRQRERLSRLLGLVVDVGARAKGEPPVVVHVQGANYNERIS